MGEPALRKALVAILGIAVIGWLLLPVPRAFLLVAGHPSDPARPADLDVRDVTFRGPSTAELSGWALSARDGAPAVVLVHGFKTSREEMLPWARFIHGAGYNVLLFDTRGCGRSGGATIGIGATEPRDISAAVSEAQTAFDTPRVAVFGISLGAGAAILAAAADSRISAVIADSAWTDQDLQLSRLSFVPIGSLRVPLPPFGTALTSAIVGTDVTAARPIDVVSRIAPRPILLIHSADDENATTPVAGAERLFAAAGQPKDLWIAQSGGHVGAINALPDEYHSRVLAFLASAFP